MKKLLFTLALFALVATSQAQTITYINTNDYIGNSRDTINDNFSNMLASVHASASNSVVVTFTQMSSNWYYWVSNSVDGGISYWLGCNTNMAGGADGNTPQGPWTNWIAGNTWGVSNAGTYKLADTNTILVMLGTNRLEVQGGATTPTNLAWNGQSIIFTFVTTNAFLPTSLAIGAGDTCIVVRTGANLFSIVATSTPTTITFDSTWTTGHVGTCLIELFAGTNSIAFPTSVVHNVGRASSTNLTIGTTTTTELLFQKPIGSIWRVIQLTP